MTTTCSISPKCCWSWFKNRSSNFPYDVNWFCQTCQSRKLVNLRVDPLNWEWAVLADIVSNWLCIDATRLNGYSGIHSGVLRLQRCHALLFSSSASMEEPSITYTVQISLCIWCALHVAVTSQKRDLQDSFRRWDPPWVSWTAILHASSHGLIQLSHGKPWIFCVTYQKACGLSSSNPHVTLNREPCVS